MFVSPQICEFPICETYFWIAHLCKFVTRINNTSGTVGKFTASAVFDLGGVP
jgi:hypothetical protein